MFQGNDSSQMWSLPSICKDLFLLYMTFFTTNLCHIIWCSEKALRINYVCVYHLVSPSSYDLQFTLQIPTNGAGLIEYRCHPFWSQKYCPSHENDNTKRCCSCERLEVRMFASAIKHVRYSPLIQLICLLFIIFIFLEVAECKIYVSWRWSELMLRVHGICNYGYRRLPTTLPFH